MSSKISGPGGLDEQEICISCGFCCDNTLFDLVRLYEDDPKPEKISTISFYKEEDENFPLPCPYFDKLCTIYDQGKPRVCSGFRCRLLHRFDRSTVSKNAAIELINECRVQRDEIIEEYNRLKGSKKTFRAILIESKWDDSFTDRPEMKLLKIKIDLLDIQLSRHFKSDEMFSDFYEFEND